METINTTNIHLQRTGIAGRRVIIMLMLLISAFFAGPLQALEVPEIKARLNDEVGIFKPQEREYIENMLRTAENKTSAQVVLLVVPNLQGESIENFSMMTVEKAKIGQKGLDNGVLVLVAMAEKKIRIEVGYGLESLITDLKAGYIIRELIVPEFEKGKYFLGLHNGLQSITGILTKEYDIGPEQLAKYQKNLKKTRGPHVSVGLIIFFIMIFVILIKNAFRGHGGGSIASAMILGSMMSSSSSYSDRSSSFFDSGGSDFSGGGGSFGGGGSSGDW